MKCNKPYSITSNNPKMSGSVKSKPYAGSYFFGGLIKKVNAMVEQKTGRNPNLGASGSSKFGKLLNRSRLADRFGTAASRGNAPAPAPAPTPSPYGRAGMVRDEDLPVRSYQKGGMITKPRKMSAAEFTKDMAEDPRKPGAMMRNVKIEIEAMAPKRKGPGTYTEKAFREREMEMAMPEYELRRKQRK